MAGVSQPNKIVEEWLFSLFETLLWRLAEMSVAFEGKPQRQKTRARWRTHRVWPAATSLPQRVSRSSQQSTYFCFPVQVPSTLALKEAEVR